MQSLQPYGDNACITKQLSFKCFNPAGQSPHLLQQATNPQQLSYQSLSQQQEEAPPFQEPQQQSRIAPQPEVGIYTL